MNTDNPRLMVRNLSVSFGTHRALDNLDLDIKAGHTLALLGANGSGKSTAVKALSGINKVETGAHVQMRGREISMDTLTPIEAQRQGLRVVHQEAPLVAALTVAEAMAMQLGFPTTFGMVRTATMLEQARNRLDAFDIRIDPRRLCGTLTPSERSLVSLAIALADVRVDEAVLVLDEATASLPTEEAHRFLVHVAEAAGRGLAVLMVTHRLAEVEEFCDEVVVLRDGKCVAEFGPESFDEVAIVQAMVGDEMLEGNTFCSADSTSTSNISMSISDLGGGALASASFEVREGTILGVAGRPGGGASDLLRLIGGIDRHTSGEIRLQEKIVQIRNPRDAVTRGIFYISSDRLTEGGVLPLTVFDNLILPLNERYGLRTKSAHHDAEQMVSTLDIKPFDTSVAFSTLSGGNQQKVLLARWLLLEPVILLLDDPTVGVDPHTREIMFEQFRMLASRGCTLIFRSSEPEQIARLCSRVLVVRDGRIVDDLTGDRITTEEVSLATFN